MICSLLLSSALTVLVTGAAFAADLPSTKGEPVYAPPPAPIFTWTGFYIGVNGGYGGNNINCMTMTHYDEGYHRLRQDHLAAASSPAARSA